MRAAETLADERPDVHNDSPFDTATNDFEE
jgi:hypothetical protein